MIIMYTDSAGHLAKQAIVIKSWHLKNFAKQIAIGFYLIKKTKVKLGSLIGQQQVYKPDCTDCVMTTMT